MITGIVYGIYKIGSDECIYVGSAWDLKSRIYVHRADSKRHLHKKLYSHIKHSGGFGEFEFRVLGERMYKDKSTKSMRLRTWFEEGYRRQLTPPFNKNRCAQTEEQRKSTECRSTQQYYRKNRQRIRATQNEKVTCECGAVLSRSNLALHRKTKKHARLMQSLESDHERLAA